MLSSRNKQIFLFFLKDKTKKNWFKIISEFSYLMLTKKEIPLYYISHLLYRKNINNYTDYLSNKENSKLLNWSQSLGKDHLELAHNKLYFEKYLLKNNIPTPRIFFYNSKHKFTYNHAEFYIETKKDLVALLDKIFAEKDVDHIFCKPTDGGRGRNIFVLDKKTYQNITNESINMLLSSSFIFQEKVEQHESLNNINASSINTLRIATYKNTENEVEILSVFMRVGRTGAIIDNAHAGGIVVPINKETGKLEAEGLQLIDNGGGIFYEHPDSGVVFNKYEIPCFAEAKEIVTKASLLYNFPLLGWDVAITPKGPIIIEVNQNLHLMLSDRMERGLKRIPSFKSMLDKIV